VRDGVIVIKYRTSGERYPSTEEEGVLKSMAVKQKKMEKIREQVDSFYKALTPSSDIISAAQSESKIIAQNTGIFKPTDSPSGVGRDQKFIGSALSLKQGELSKPFEGNRGTILSNFIEDAF